jgi:hypothetical protein
MIADIRQRLIQLYREGGLVMTRKTPALGFSVSRVLAREYLRLANERDDQERLVPPRGKKVCCAPAGE